MDELNELNELNEFNENILINENNEIENENIENENIENDIIPKYERILELLGLNKNINYPQSIILEGIIEMHTSKDKQYHSYSKHARIYKFKTDNISKKLEYMLYAGNGMLTSYLNIFRNLRRIYRNYNYNKIANKVSNQIIIKNDDLMLGFNYNNQRWNTLTSYVIE